MPNTDKVCKQLDISSPILQTGFDWSFWEGDGSKSPEKGWGQFQVSNQELSYRRRDKA
jgi:hypothetical protein